MPGQDRTGPAGQGPMTGRQMGNCDGARPMAGRGFGLGFGMGCRRFGRGFGFRANAVEFTKDQKEKVLEAELAEIEAEKKELEKQLKEIKVYSK